LLSIQKGEKMNMQTKYSKAVAFLIAAVLIVSISTSIMLIPTTTAHTPSWQIPTFAYINAAPNPVGVGQTVNIVMWLDKVYDNALLINNNRFHNYNLTIVKPDGSIETHTFDTITDSTSSQGYAYTPQQTGTYTLIFTYPGQAVNDYTHDATSAYVNDTYLGSTAHTTLTVQNEPIANAPDSYPLPTEYWTRPIYGENPYWWTISSNWLGLGSAIDASVGSGTLSQASTQNYQRYPGDAVGPQTSHIMWTKPFQNGGVVGGNMFTVAGETFFDGSAYDQRLANPIIVNGKLYYTEPLSMPSASSLGGGVYGPTKCVDLRTGQVIWSRTDVPALSFAYTYDIRDPQQYGVYPTILFTANFAQAFDADTGTPLFNVTKVPTGTIVAGPQGEQLRLTLTNCGTAANPQWYLAEWNSSKLWTGNGFATDYPAGSILQWVPTAQGTIDASISSGPANRYDWNVSVSEINSIAGVSAPSAVVALRDDMMILRSGALPSFSTQTQYTYYAISLKSGSIGNLLWKQTYNPPAGNVTVLQGPADTVNRVFVEAYKETSNFVGYSMDTGVKLWGPTPSQAALDYYGNAGTAGVGAQAAYGKLYSIGYSGILYCYDSKTGNLLWTYGNGGTGNSTSSGFETGQGTYPAIIGAVGNGIIYIYSAEHTVQTPIYKGALTRAINATDGSEIWTLSSYVNTFTSQSFAIADGFAVFPNSYDNQVYSVGRGPSATTVDAPMADIALGSGLVIRGTVTDISAGTQQSQQAADFPNGVPVASDASMSDWMGYVYQQKPLPSNFTGVDVTISVIDSNGNYRTIGTTTTDSSGSYGFQWTPDITGKYTVIATFAGTNGYWPSSAETSIAVDNAAATPAPQATQAPSEADLYFVPAIAGLFVAIAICIVMIALVLRKHP
jgi:FOG: WD40-like repeat